MASCLLTVLHFCVFVVAVQSFAVLSSRGSVRYGDEITDFEDANDFAEDNKFGQHQEAELPPDDDFRLGDRAGIVASNCPKGYVRVGPYCVPEEKD